MVGHPDVLIQRFGCIRLERSQPVDPFVARDRGEPRSEGTCRVVGVTLLVDCQQNVLNRILGHGRWQAPSVVPAQPQGQFGEKSSIRIRISHLRGGHHPIPVVAGCIAGLGAHSRGHIGSIRCGSWRRTWDVLIPRPEHHVRHRLASGYTHRRYIAGRRSARYNLPCSAVHHEPKKPSPQSLDIPACPVCYVTPIRTPRWEEGFEMLAAGRTAAVGCFRIHRLK